MICFLRNFFYIYWQQICLSFFWLLEENLHKFFFQISTFITIWRKCQMKTFLHSTPSGAYTFFLQDFGDLFNMKGTWIKFGRILLRLRKGFEFNCEIINWGFGKKKATSVLTFSTLYYFSIRFVKMYWLNAWSIIYYC